MDQENAGVLRRLIEHHTATRREIAGGMGNGVDRDALADDSEVVAAALIAAKIGRQNGESTESVSMEKHNGIGVGTRRGRL